MTKNVCVGCVNIKICSRNTKKLTNIVRACSQRNRVDDKIIFLKKPNLVTDW